MAEPKRVTVKVSDELHYKARLKSVKVNKPISEVVREALEKWTADGDPSEEDEDNGRGRKKAQKGESG